MGFKIGDSILYRDKKFRVTCIADDGTPYSGDKRLHLAFCEHSNDQISSDSPCSDIKKVSYIRNKAIYSLANDDIIQFNI